MRMTYLTVALTSVVAVGCGATTSSGNIRTAGVVALIDVTSTQSGDATVKAELVVGGANSNTNLILDGSDKLVASNGKTDQVMQSVGGEEYETRFTKAKKKFQVRFERDGDDGAPKNKGKLPDDFEVTTDFGAEPISRKDALTVAWSPSGDSSDVVIEVDGECIHGEKFKLGGDPGTYTIEAEKISAWKSKEDQACNVVLTIVRTSKGTTDPALDADSRFLLHQVREARFVSGP